MSGWFVIQAIIVVVAVVVLLVISWLSKKHFNLWEDPPKKQK